MVIFEKILKRKSNPNTQISGGACPRTPLAKRMASKSGKKILGYPPC